MKLLYLANVRLPTERAYGGQIVHTCAALAKAGVEVELVIPTRRKTSAEAIFSYYGEAETFRFRRMACPDFVRFGEMGFFISALWFAEAAHFLHAFWQADVIYSRDAFILAQYVLLGRRLAYEAHGAPRWLERFVARRAERVVVISHALAKAYEAAGVAPEKILVAPDAVSDAFFVETPKDEARKRLSLPLDKKIVAYTGHLYARKGADVLAEAATQLPDVLFVFVGGLPQDLERFRKQWGSVPNIRTIGHVPPSEVPSYLRAADVLVLPNSAKSEDARAFTSPMKLFEYMASGTPLVASDVPALQEILSDKTATFFAPDDSASLAAAIQTALKQPESSAQKASHAQSAAHEYTWEKRAERINKALKEIA